jgi:hypothetical protein
MTAVPSQQKFYEMARYELVKIRTSNEDIRRI